MEIFSPKGISANQLDWLREIKPGIQIEVVVNLENGPEKKIRFVLVKKEEVLFQNKARIFERFEGNEITFFVSNSKQSEDNFLVLRGLEK